VATLKEGEKGEEGQKFGIAYNLGTWKAEAGRLQI
jgi:hypothetical protein